MREKIRKAIQYFLSAVVLWEVTTATGNSFHNLFPKTAFRILFKIWLWIYGFIIFTKYKATSLLCSWLQIKCFSSPETSHLKKAVAELGISVPPDAIASSHIRKNSAFALHPHSGFSPQCHQKLNHGFVAGLSLQRPKRKKRPLAPQATKTIFFAMSHHSPASAPPATPGTMALFIARERLTINH